LLKFVSALRGATFAACLLLSPINAKLYGQAAPQAATSSTSSIPDAPEPQNSSAQQPPNTTQASTAVLSGTVVDTNGGVVQGARVALRRRSGANAQIMQSGSDGQFAFNGLPPGPYRLTVTANGMRTYASPEIELQAGEVRILPQIALNVTAETSVTVTADKNVLSVEQVQIAEQQRVLGVLPNFYMTFDWNAPPMQPKDKFKLNLRETFDPTEFVVIAGVAGAEQYKNIYPSFGGGWEGYGKRYGATFANHVTGEFFGSAVYPAIFHQDPRYFYKGNGSIPSRAFYAISRAVIARGDNGKWQPDYSGILGKLTSGAIANAYYPEQERGAGLVFFNAFTELGAQATVNLIKEFILKDITSHKPGGANGEP
jgi:hypothetical protein